MKHVMLWMALPFQCEAAIVQDGPAWFANLQRGDEPSCKPMHPPVCIFPGGQESMWGAYPQAEGCLAFVDREISIHWLTLGGHWRLQVQVSQS